MLNFGFQYTLSQEVGYTLLNYTLLNYQVNVDFLQVTGCFPVFLSRTILEIYFRTFHKCTA